MSSAPVSVGRLRVQDVRRDPLATRVALDRLLTTAALRPPGLPPAAVLVVRALRDPLPRRLQLEHAGIRPPPEWEHAVATALDDLARGAARPAREAVGANAAAVLFADRAELLACLLADWAAGAVESRWWWRLVVRSSPDVAVPAELRASPTYVPAAFAALADRGVAVAVAAALPREEALATARSVAAAFGVPVPDAVELRAEQPTAAAAAPGPPFERVTPAHGVSPASASWSAVVAKLSAAVPEARASGLRAEQRLLLAVALGLRRAPAALRRPAEQAPEPPPLPASPTPASRRQAPALPAAAERARPPAGVAPAAPTPRPEDGVAAATGVDESPAETPRRGRAASERTAGGADPAPATPGSPPATSHPDAERRPVGSEPAIAPPSAPFQRPETASPPKTATTRTPRGRAEVSAPELPAAPGSAPEPAPPPVQHAPENAGMSLLGPAVETRLGGLFFLVNAGIDLGLYGDFTQPSRPGIALDLWDFITLVGRRLLRGADDDAVWRLLAELAGREPEDPPGAGFVPPGGRTLADWSVDAADEIRAVLAAADLTPRRVLRRPAAVHVTDAHVDVVFPLAGHPLEIRIAGLDRDPGFVPAAGRHVAFHFE